MLEVNLLSRLSAIDILKDMFDPTAFPKEKTDSLIRLPYRVGLWVSESDDTGGDEADEKELIVLQSLIMAYAQDFCKSEFVQGLMEETVKHRSQWESWHANTEQVEQECRELIYFLQDHLPKKELNAFKANLYEIGYSVAMAYREFDEDTPFVEKLKAYLTLWIAQVRAALSGTAPKTEDEILNISSSEKMALDKLKNALGYFFEEEAVNT